MDADHVCEHNGYECWCYCHDDNDCKCDCCWEDRDSETDEDEENGEYRCEDEYALSGWEEALRG